MTKPNFKNPYWRDTLPDDLNDEQREKLEADYEDWIELQNEMRRDRMMMAVGLWPFDN